MSAAERPSERVAKMPREELERAHVEVMQNFSALREKLFVTEGRMIRAEQARDRVNSEGRARQTKSGNEPVKPAAT